MLETRSPGYVLRVEDGQVDSVRFEQLLAAARTAQPEERAATLRQALALWRGPALADLAYDDFAQAEIRRLEELRLVAREERIGADAELGRHADIVAELESLVSEQPLRERPRELLMQAYYCSGRQAEALEAYQEARRAFVGELGVEPGRRLQDLQARILRQDATICPGSAGRDGHPADVDDEIAKALLAGRVVPVLGLAGSAALAERLATAFDYPRDRPLDLARVCQYVATMRGAGRLWDELHDRFEAAIEPEPVHRFLAALPPLLRERGVPHQLIVTTNYDLGLERAFEEAEEELDVVAYVASGPNQGRFWHRPPGEPPRPVEVPNAYTELSLDERTVLLKLRGAVDPHPEREWESFVATEDDYIDFLGRSELATAVPVTLAARLRRSHFLFVGYEMADWNLRLMLNRVWGDSGVPYASWVVAGAAECPRAGLLAPFRCRRRRSRRGCAHPCPVGSNGLGGRFVSAPALSSPYKGLSPFGDSEVDALLFFGRERDMEIVVANLIASRLTVLYGPSGVGKSSLLHAGVARSLRELPERPLVVLFSSWGDDPATALAREIAQGADVESGLLLDTLRRAQAGVRDVYVILDQAEEYFLYHPGGSAFENELAAISLRAAARERSALASRGRAREARSLQGADPEHPRQLPAARSARPAGRGSCHRAAARALSRPRRFRRALPARARRRGARPGRRRTDP